MPSPCRPTWCLALFALLTVAAGCVRDGAAGAAAGSAQVSLLGVVVHQEPGDKAAARWFDVDFTVRRSASPATPGRLALELVVWVADRQAVRARRPLAVDLGNLAVGEQRRYSLRVTDLAYQPGDRFTLSLASATGPGD
jgi:hypothetical protein